MRSRTCVRLTFFFFFLSRFHEHMYEQSYVRSAHYHVPATSHLTHVPTTVHHQLPTQTTNRTLHQTSNRAGKTKKKGSLGYPFLFEVCFFPHHPFLPTEHTYT